MASLDVLASGVRVDKELSAFQRSTAETHVCSRPQSYLLQCEHCQESSLEPKISGRGDKRPPCRIHPRVQVGTDQDVPIVKTWWNMGLR